MNLIEIPIYFNPDNSEELIALKGSVPVDKFIIKLVLFTNIPDAIYDDEDEDSNSRNVQFTRFYLNGISWATPMPKTVLIERFNSLVTMNKIHRFN